MSAARAERLAAEIANLLSRERDLLVAGRFGDLTRTAQTRDALLERLGALDAAALRRAGEQIERIRRAAGRNMALLKAALEGAAAARRRIAALGDPVAPLSSYDASGAPVQHGAGAGGMARRA